MPGSRDGGLRPDADRVRLRAEPSDVPDPRRPDRAARPASSAYSSSWPHGPRARCPTTSCRDGARPGADRGGDGGRQGPRPGPTSPRGLGSDDNPTFPACTRRPRHVVGASIEAARQVWTRRGLHTRQHRRRPAPRDARPGQRLLRLQRRRRRHPLAARQRRREGRLRRRRRPPRRRRREDLLRRPAGAHDLACTRPARCSSRAPASRPDSGGPDAAGQRGQRRAAARHVGRRAGCAPSTRWCRRCVREFAPDVLVTQHGCDSHRDDPLAHLMLSVDGQRAAYLALHDLAHEVGGRHAGWPPAAAATRSSTWSRAPGPTCSRRRRAPLDPSTATPEAWRATCGSCSAGPRRPDDRRPRPRPTATGRRATTPPPGSTARSTPPGRRSSRCTASTRSRDPIRTVWNGKIGVVSTRHARVTASFFRDFLPHESHQALFSPRSAGRGSPEGKPVACLPRETVPAMPDHDRPETSPT